jgi:hypothetical protein
MLVLMFILLHHRNLDASQPSGSRDHGRPLPDRRVDADDVQVVAHCLDAEPAVGHLRDDPRTGVGGGGVGAKADHRTTYLAAPSRMTAMETP